MRVFRYDFSVLEPIESNEDFCDKVTEQVYPTLFSILSPRRFIAAALIGEFANQGEFKMIGRYRLELRFIWTKVHVKLTRSV